MASLFRTMHQIPWASAMTRTTIPIVSTRDRGDGVDRGTEAWRLDVANSIAAAPRTRTGKVTAGGGAQPEAREKNHHRDREPNPNAGA
jgi:hypothetical protein